EDVKKVYRMAKKTDIDKWIEAQKREVDTMYKARTIAIALGLQMKISDVEYQGDNTKAIFYYTAEGRVDFRELIKKLADEFRVRIEMKQIGVRQEASRLGGIGSCGRELCCSSWLTDFRSVSTSAARYQQLSLNPQKLAGQCGKLKCCLNFELDGYVEALKEFPDTNLKLKTKKGQAFYRKMDIFKNMMWYSYQDEPLKFIELKLDRVNQIVEMNKNDELPSDLMDFVDFKEVIKEPDYANVVGQDSLTRFDGKKGGKNKKRRKNNNNNKNRNNNNRNRNRNKNNKGNNA
ncbi:MAG: regulatory iron-sulfur-containing complex subunit RicT, partial [Vicingaceae bacterium]|nr:regulatory iron-sulfur-containing complex subunit RicT [Vicingaceae bacterium]